MYGTGIPRAAVTALIVVDLPRDPVTTKKRVFLKTLLR
jgi:hypothetical protein